MSKLTKEEVISKLEAALSAKEGKAVTIEQKGSWFKIDGGKSMRFSELEAMLEEQGEVVAPAAEKPAAAKPKAKAAPAKKKTPAKKAASGNGGLTPKELWRQKLAGQNAKLPRGF
ncbi:hypothetical protein L2750_10335 [Shewanella submarina]|uniref:DNA-binding protein n=1 Tax=Shewanella submarina TaxID=2016376 RepID=A0ABV7GDT9_9GAMM|nr:hypothetical protein [Shewanella submarina]MCL1037546.1 hypothetical protein [Shewanella submarina]